MEDLSQRTDECWFFKFTLKKLFYYDKNDFIVDKSRVYKTGYLLILNSQWGEENLGLGRDEKKTYLRYIVK